MIRRHWMGLSCTYMFALVVAAAEAGALYGDGTVVGWGVMNFGQDLSHGFSAIAAGGRHSLALKEDGSIVAFGCNDHGQARVPEPNSGFVAVAAGENHSLGLRTDGSVVGWGVYYSSGEHSVPEPNTDFVAIAGGCDFSLGLKKDGSIVALIGTRTAWRTR